MNCTTSSRSPLPDNKFFTQRRGDKEPQRKFVFLKSLKSLRLFNSASLREKNARSPLPDNKFFAQRRGDKEPQRKFVFQKSLKSLRLFNSASLREKNARSPFPVPRFAALLLCVAAAGCFSRSSRTPQTLWTISPVAEEGIVRSEAKWETVRLGAVTVSPPCESAPVFVRRQDGSVAHDPVHQFAAGPGALMRNVVWKALEEDGRFGTVLSPGSSAASGATVECHIRDISLDCPPSGGRYAQIELVIEITDARTRRLVAQGKGSSRVNAASGNYTAAFSAAAANALRQALKVEIGD